MRLPSGMSLVMTLPASVLWSRDTSPRPSSMDNACAENFFGLLKTELLYLQEFDSVEHFIAELKAYIEWYNTKRIKLKLDGLSPVEFRLANAA